MNATQKRLRERQQKNRELAAKDAINRCPICRRDLAEVPGTVVLVGFTHQRFCSKECVEEARGRS